MNLIKSRWQQYNFLFEQIVKRDFKKRYKRTYLGVLWSMLGCCLKTLSFQRNISALVFTGARIVQHLQLHTPC